MSGSAKKRREKERQRDRRWRNRRTWYRFVGDKFVPEAIGAYALRRAVERHAPELREIS